MRCSCTDDEMIMDMEQMQLPINTTTTTTNSLNNNNNNVARLRKLNKYQQQTIKATGLTKNYLSTKLEKFNCIHLLEKNEDNNNMKNVNSSNHNNIPKKKSCWTSQCGKSIFEIFLRISLFVIFIQIERTPAFKRKILPEELSLYKYPPTKDYVPAAYLMPAAFIIPFIVVLINYLITHDRNDFTQGNNAVTLALALNGIITSLIKITVGRPRPDFYYRCFPEGLLDDDHNHINFNNNFELDCTGDLKTINEGRKSFPSGHSSFAFAGFGFIFLYLAAKLHVFNERGRGQTWRLCIVLLPLMIALLVAISRTCDYHHHWQDVVIGSIIGMFIAYLCYRQYYPSIFSIQPQKPFTNRPTLICIENYYDDPTLETMGGVGDMPIVNDMNGELTSLIDEEDKDTKWI